MCTTGREPDTTREALEAMSESSDWRERALAGRLLARHDPAEVEETILRLLRDPGNAAVSESMVAALLQSHREDAIPLVLRSLGQDLPAQQNYGEAFDEAGRLRLEGLLESELDGVEVRQTIVFVLLESDERDEIAGALRAIGWLAPSGGFSAPPAAFARVRELMGDPDDTLAGLAREALAALA